jgi:hypothetical protein
VLRDPGPITFTVAPLGRGYQPETQNTVTLANTAQKAFKFVFRAETVPIEEDKYKLTNGALDLRKAVGDLLRHESFKRLASGQLIFVTSKPDSDQDSADQYGSLSLEEQCYFYHDSLQFDESLPFDEILPFAKNVSIVSTYIWDHLPRIIGVPTTNSGRRALEPYLFLSFAMIALSRCIDMPLPHHTETRGCPLDYCDTVQEIDRFFQGGRLCDECERILQTKRRNGEITAEQLDSVKKLLLRARGRDYEYDVAMSFAGSERELAEQLSAIIRKAGFKVFYDDFYAEEIVGKNLTDFFDEVYRKTSRFCVIIVSHEYARRMWTTLERQRAQARHRQEMGNDYIIPIVVEYEDLSGLLETTGYLSLERYSLERIAEILIGRLSRP